MKPSQTPTGDTAASTCPKIHSVKWSTEGIPERQRLEYWTQAVSATLFEMDITTPVTSGFVSFVESTTLSEIVVSALGGSRRVATRSSRFVAGASDYSYHLLVDFLQPWVLTWRGNEISLGAGQIVLSDTRYVHSANYPGDSLAGRANLKLKPVWVAKWLRDPQRLVATPISGRSGWGWALSCFIAQLTPKFAMGPPLPAKLIEDHLGSLLSLVEQEMFPGTQIKRIDDGLVDKIVISMRQRACDGYLVASDIAAALDISERTLHRVLQRNDKIFSKVLRDIRIESAQLMLQAMHFRTITIAEIGRRCGFNDAAYFSRVMTAKLGQAPGSYRSTFMSEASATSICGI